MSLPVMSPSLLLETYLDNVWKQTPPSPKKVKDGDTLSIPDRCKFFNV